MFHRSTGSTGRQRISAVVFAFSLILTMTFPSAAAPSRPDPFLTDLGDLPATYPTEIDNSGPSHQIGNSSLLLGACVDGEADGQPDAIATGDDGAVGHPVIGDPPCASDEDGVMLVPGKGGASNGGGWTNGTVATGNGGAVQVTITGGPACLGAFFDFADTGTTLTLVQLYYPDDTPVTGPIPASPGSPPATYTFYFDIAPDAFNGSTSQPINARFRVTSPAGTSCANSPAFSSTGPAFDGEVEDYQWSFGPNAVTLSGMTASSATMPLALPLGLMIFLGALLGGIVLARRPA